MIQSIQECRYMLSLACFPLQPDDCHTGRVADGDVQGGGDVCTHSCSLTSAVAQNLASAASANARGNPLGPHSDLVYQRRS